MKEASISELEAAEISALVEQFRNGKVLLPDFTKALNRFGFPQDGFVIGKVHEAGKIDQYFGVPETNHNESQPKPSEIYYFAKKLGEKFNQSWFQDIYKGGSLIYTSLKISEILEKSGIKLDSQVRLKTDDVPKFVDSLFESEAIFAVYCGTKTFIPDGQMEKIKKNIILKLIQSDLVSPRLSAKDAQKYMLKKYNDINDPRILYLIDLRIDSRSIAALVDKYGTIKNMKEAGLNDLKKIPRISRCFYKKTGFPPEVWKVWQYIQNPSNFFNAPGEPFKEVKHFRILIATPRTIDIDGKANPAEYFSENLADDNYVYECEVDVIKEIDIAVNKLISQRYDFVVLDQTLFESKVFDLLKTYKPETPETIFIVAKGMGQDWVIKQAEQNGAEGCFEAYELHSCKGLIKIIRKYMKDPIK